MNNSLIFCFLIHTHTDPPSVLASENYVEQIILFIIKIQVGQNSSHNIYSISIVPIEPLGGFVWSTCVSITCITEARLMFSSGS